MGSRVAAGLALAFTLAFPFAAALPLASYSEGGVSDLVTPFFIPKFFNRDVHGTGSSRLALAFGLSLWRASGTAWLVTGVMREGA